MTASQNVVKSDPNVLVRVADPDPAKSGYPFGSGSATLYKITSLSCEQGHFRTCFWGVVAASYVV
jgi:hypothetical protein